MKLTRELDTVMTISKLFTHTPVRSEMTKKKLELKVPALYSTFMIRKTEKMCNDVEKHFSYYLEKIS
jgi:hypothetical protein